MVGAIVLAGLLSGNVGAEVPTVVAPVIGFRPVVAYGRPRTTETAEVAPTSIPGPWRSPEPSATPRPTPRQPVPKTQKPPVPPRTVTGGRQIIGVATWYCKPGVSICTRGYPASGAYGAAGPELRAVLGHWRGRTVYVNGVRVTLIDWCACGGDHVIDVYHSTWVRIPNQNHVTIRW